MFEVCIGVILGALIVAATYEINCAIMFPRDYKLAFEGFVICIEALELILMLRIQKILVLEEKFK